MPHVPANGVTGVATLGRRSARLSGWSNEGYGRCGHEALAAAPKAIQMAPRGQSMF
jgi:hypothetical protein